MIFLFRSSSLKQLKYLRFSTSNEMIAKKKGSQGVFMLISSSMSSWNLISNYLSFSGFLTLVISHLIRWVFSLSPSIVPRTIPWAPCWSAFNAKGFSGTDLFYPYPDGLKGNVLWAAKSINSTAIRLLPRMMNSQGDIQSPIPPFIKVFKVITEIFHWSARMLYLSSCWLPPPRANI